MISENNNNEHQKHAKLTRRDLGAFGANEIGIIGTVCATIKKLAYSIMGAHPAKKVAFVDADHKNVFDSEFTNNKALANGGFLEYTDKISFHRLDFKSGETSFQKRTIFNEVDLIIINGNHFPSKAQVVVIDPAKSLEKKLSELTDVKLILLKENSLSIPTYIQQLTGFEKIPILAIDNKVGIQKFIENFLIESRPPLNGLVLSGGQSSRMKQDKGNLQYHGITQREFLHSLLSKYCSLAFVSVNAEQALVIDGKLPVIEDTFLNLGPTGGILSALQKDPNAAWLTIACDLPYLSEKTIDFLIQHRNPSKIATAFLDPNGEFPEPLITIWEPKSYPILLQFLSQGYSCPRKILINSDIELLKAPDEKEFLNANFSEQYEDALRHLQAK